MMTPAICLFWGHEVEASGESGPIGPVTWPAIFAQLLTRPDGAVAKTRAFPKVKRRALLYVSYQGTM